MVLVTFMRCPSNVTENPPSFSQAITLTHFIMHIFGANSFIEILRQNQGLNCVGIGSRIRLLHELASGSFSVVNKGV